MRDKNDLQTIELQAMDICALIQRNCKKLGKNLTNNIQENSIHLIRLYECRRVLDELNEVLPQHDVIDKNTGKNLGALYDNEYVEGVMMATNIGVESAIQHTEWHLQKISCADLIL